MENKFLKYIKNSENLDNNLISDLSEHDINNSENLLLILKKSLKDYDVYQCEHDIEEVCAYAEGNYDNEQIKNQILECDNCFENYTFLKSKVQEINNISPPYFKEKVYDKKENLIIKKSFLNVIKNNKLLKYSSGAIAASLLLFISLNPFSTNMSDFHKSKFENQNSESTQVSQNNDAIPPQSSIESKNSDLSQIQPRPKNQNEKRNKQLSLSKKDIPVKESYGTDKKTISNNNVSKRNNSTIINNGDITLKKQSRSVDNSNNIDTKPKEPMTITKEPVEIRKEVLINKPSVLSKNPASPQEKEVNETQKDFNVNPYLNTDINKDDSRNQSFEEDTNLNNTQPSVQTAPVAPKLYKSIPEKLETKKKNENSTINDENNFFNIKLKFNISNDGFIVIKDLNESVIYTSGLLKKGNYNNFIVNLSTKKYNKYFYIDTNLNGFFDENDLLDRSVKITE